MNSVQIPDSCSGSSRVARPAPAAIGHMRALLPVIDALRDLETLDNWRNVLFIAEDWLVIAFAITSACVLRHTAVAALAYVVSVILVGSRMRALMNLVHQASHGQLFRSKVANAWVGRVLLAWPLLISMEAYRTEHREHHTKLWDPERDPKVARLRRFGLLRPESRRVRFVWKHVISPITLRYAPTNVIATLRTSTERVGRLTTILVVVVLVLLARLEVQLVMFWFVPYITSFQVFRYWAEMAEHSGLQSDRPWTATRNWTAPLPVRWLMAPHSDHWHLAHHIHAGIPHFRLAAAHRVLMRVSEYADEGHHCDGLFFRHRPDAPSVVGDLMHPETMYEARPRRSAASRTDRMGRTLRAS